MAAERGVELLARTVRGVEWVAAAEVDGRLGVEADRVGHRELRFRMPALDPAVLELGTVDDVFVVVGESDGIGHTRSELPRLAAAAAQAAPQRALSALRSLRPVGERPRFDVTATFLGGRNFNRFEIEDAAGAAVAQATGWRYESRSEGPPPQTEVTLRVHLGGERATFALRAGAAPLHRRPYRQVSRAGSLRPPVARCLALLAGLGAVRVLDPFCGAGTIPIEAALAEPRAVALGSDIDAGVVELARANAENARIDCEFTVADAAGLPMPDGVAGRLATNPPWGEGVRAEGSLADAWREVRRVLRADCRAAVLGPPALLDGCERALGLPRVVSQPVRVLGMPVEIRVLAPSPTFAEAGVLYGAELDRARRRFAR